MKNKMHYKTNAKSLQDSLSYLNGIRNGLESIKCNLVVEDFSTILNHTLNLDVAR